VNDYQVFITKSCLNDILDAFDRYKDFTGNDAFPLAERIDKAITLLEVNPFLQVNEDYQGQIRSIGIERHSYRLYYRMSEHSLEVIAFAFESHRQDPARIINEVNRRIERLDSREEQLITFEPMTE
jgi:hypothetical protein